MAAAAGEPHCLKQKKRDVLLHEGTCKLASGSQVYLMAIARRVNQRKPDCILVLKLLEEKRDFEIHAHILVMAPAYVRIGIIDGTNGMEEDDFKNLVRRCRNKASSSLLKCIPI